MGAIVVLIVDGAGQDAAPSVTVVGTQTPLW